MKHQNLKHNPDNSSQAFLITYGVGIKKGNPRLCLGCGKPIKRGESWRKDTSPEDPQLGRYSIIRHSPKCPDQKEYLAFQKSLHSAN
jgi:hypothetical protein